MLEKVQAMLADALSISVSKVTPDARIIEDLGADSLDVVELLSRLEDEYGVVIPDEDVENMKTVADVAATLEKIMKKFPQFAARKPPKVFSGAFLRF